MIELSTFDLSRMPFVHRPETRGIHTSGVGERVNLLKISVGNVQLYIR